MILFLKIWGGVFYLLNKVFFFYAERAKNDGNKYLEYQNRIASWTVYLVGLPAWVIFFVINDRSIAAILEAAGGPAMLVGLIITIQKQQQKGTSQRLSFLKGIFEWFAIACIPIGFGISIRNFGGFHELTQWLETILVIGYLVGTYYIAKKRPSGYLWYIPMHLATAWLVWIDGSTWLLIQQVVSIPFVLGAYIMAVRAQQPQRIFR